MYWHLGIEQMKRIHIYAQELLQVSSPFTSCIPVHKVEMHSI
jgi:hypothetical protein